MRPDDTYTAERGYGFDFNSQVVAMASASGADPVVDGGVTCDQAPFFFSVQVPEGNYRVTVVLGGEAAAETTVRSEAAHLMLVDVKTSPGTTVKHTFYANVRRPELPNPPPNAPGGTRVHMFLASEPGARTWDDRLTLEFNGRRPALCSLELERDDRVPTVFVAGDSTVGDPRSGPGGNWPTQLCQFFKPEVAVCNSAEGGETSKSFITGLRMDKVLSQMKPGDFFLIQFAHNDSKPQWPQSYTEPGTTFNAYLRVFIAETRRRGATPILVTPMERRANGDTVGRWARAMQEVAAQENVALIDQWSASKRLWTALGERVGEAFTDPTHLSGYGGYLLARLMVGGIRAEVPELARHLRDEATVMSPEAPEPPPAYLQQRAAP